MVSIDYSTLPLCSTIKCVWNQQNKIRPVVKMLPVSDKVEDQAKNEHADGELLDRGHQPPGSYKIKKTS